MGCSLASHTTVLTHHRLAFMVMMAFDDDDDDDLMVSVIGSREPSQWAVGWPDSHWTSS